MYKYTFWIFIFLLANSNLFGQLTPEDYKVYSAIISSEIESNTKSVAIIKAGIDSGETADNLHGTMESLASGDIKIKSQVYLWTENFERKRPSVIDSANERFIIDYCHTGHQPFSLANEFEQDYKTVLVDKFTTQKSVNQNWEDFYRKHPRADGIFSFSGISYYLPGKTTAIVYYWHRRSGLNGHGALAILEKVKAEWQVKYRVYLWQN